MAQLVEVLAQLHVARIIHRDIKPENILLVDTNPDHLRIKLADFDLAIKMSESRVDDRPRVNSLYGTLSCMISSVTVPPASWELESHLRRRD